MQLYHIIFERFYQAFHRGWGGFDRDDTISGGSLIATLNISTLFSMQIMTIYVYCSVVFWGELIFNSGLFYSISIIIYPINLIYIFYKKRYLKIIEEVRLCRSKKQRNKHTLLTVGFVLFCLMFFVSGLCLMGC